MKLSRQHRRAKAPGLGLFFVALTFLSVQAGFGAPASETPPEGTASRAVAAAGAARKSGLTESIIKMVDAGVSKEIIRSFVENSPAYAASPEDIIALKQHAVADEITAAMVKRMGDFYRQGNSGKTSAATASAAQDSAAGLGGSIAPVELGGLARLDPESHDFWWYHYAYPRALSYARETLYPWQGSYPYGVYYPGPVGLSFSTGFPAARFAPGPAGGWSELHNRSLQASSTLVRRQTSLPLRPLPFAPWPP